MKKEVLLCDNCKKQVDCYAVNNWVFVDVQTPMGCHYDFCGFECCVEKFKLFYVPRTKPTSNSPAPSEPTTPPNPSTPTQSAAAS